MEDGKRKLKQNYGSADKKQQTQVNYLYKMQQEDHGGRWEMAEVDAVIMKTSFLPSESWSSL